MRKFKVNTDSFHYQIVRLGCDYLDPRPSNFCAYWATFITKMLIVAFAMMCMLVMIGGVAIVTYRDPMMVLSFVSLLAAVIIIPFVFIGFMMLATDKLQTSDGLVATKYKSHKQRVCPQVEYEDRKDGN